MCVVSVSSLKLWNLILIKQFWVAKGKKTMIRISFPAKFLLLQCVLQNCHCQEMIYIVLFYIDRKNLHFVGGVEKNFNDLVQNAKKVPVHTYMGIVHRTCLEIVNIQYTTRVLWNSLTDLLNWVNCCVGYEKS